MIRRAIRKREGWTRLSAPGAKCSAEWRHDASGWLVKHCGHPTANYPYSAHDPAVPDKCVMSFNGRGWVTLEIAFVVVERIVSGELHVTSERCGPMTLRVLGTTCAGDRIEERVEVPR